MTDFAIGDDVVALAEASFATYAIADSRMVARLPRGVSHADAATVPFAFMTARYALLELGALAAGETVLIHAGAGGVGLAAVRIAQQAGATVIATAGSDAKRAYLRRIGVAHVLHSRTLAFAQEVRALTAGRGVDVVLNSLAGEFIAASVDCLAPDGRFLEIGKRDIWDDAQFRAVRPGGRYCAIDLAAMRYGDPAAAAAQFRDVMREFEVGHIAPLPRQTFPLARAADAFRFMAQARHVGKVVLTNHDAERASLDHVRAHATYLITGGLTGLGLRAAQRLVERGARTLVLMGRRDPAPSALDTIAALRAEGANVVVMPGDVSRTTDVARVLGTIVAELPPLRGIIHSAGALADGAVLQQQWEQFREPLRAKIDGAWTLHTLTRDHQLDWFVLFSSVASVLGSRGQGNHAAANAFLDALAQHRRALGLPALAVSWGAWSDIGAAADRGVDAQVGARGVGAIAPARGLAILEALMRGERAHVVVSPVDWNRFLDPATPQASRRFFDRVRDILRVSPAAPRRAAPSLAASAARTADVFMDELRSATAMRRAELLLAYVGEHVARVVGAPSAASIEADQPLNELGLDSLMAVELRNRLGAGLGLARSLPATLVFDHPTLDALAVYLGGALAPSARPGSAATAPARHDAGSTVDELSDEQVEELFARKMRNA